MAVALDCSTLLPGNPTASLPARADTYSLNVSFSRATAYLVIDKYAVRYQESVNGAVSDSNWTAQEVSPAPYSTYTYTTTISNLKKGAAYAVQSGSYDPDGIFPCNWQWNTATAFKTVAGAAPAVTRGPALPETSVYASWTAPIGVPAMRGYDVQYRKKGDADWTEFEPLVDTDYGLDTNVTNVVIPGLEVATEYEVRARATNVEGTSGYSAPGSGWTDGIRLLVEGGSVAENVPASVTIGYPAAYPYKADGLTLSVSVGAAKDTAAAGTDYQAVGGFALDVTGGRPNSRAVAISPVDNQLHEADKSISVTGAASNNVTVLPAGITIVNDDALTGPAVSVSRSSASPATALGVSWIPHASYGANITGYQAQYRRQGADDWTGHPHGGTTTATTIAGLARGTTYEVRVRANGGLSDPWSGVVSAATGANEDPVFPSATAARSVAENSAADTAVGAPAGEKFRQSPDGAGRELDGAGYRRQAAYHGL